MTEQETECRVDALLETPYWVIDLLPMQVQKDSPGNFFAVERYMLSGPRIGTLRQKWADLLLKLSCYYDLLLCANSDAEASHTPAPEELAERVLSGEYLVLLLEREDALIIVDNDSLGLALYHPDARLLSLVKALADAAGLFVWQPEEKR